MHFIGAKLKVDAAERPRYDGRKISSAARKYNELRKTLSGSEFF